VAGKHGWQNGKTVGKLWEKYGKLKESYGKIRGKLWENYGKTMAEF
jgi:hypothetical protein